MRFGAKWLCNCAGGVCSPLICRGLGGVHSCTAVFEDLFCVRLARQNPASESRLGARLWFFYVVRLVLPDEDGWL